MTVSQQEHATLGSCSCLSACLSVSLSVCLTMVVMSNMITITGYNKCLWVCRSVAQSVRLSVCLSIVLSVSMYVRVSISQSVCLPVHHPSACLFVRLSVRATPTYRQIYAYGKFLSQNFIKKIIEIYLIY